MGGIRDPTDNEFQAILNEYRLQLAAANNTAGLANLAKIVNLYESRKDVVHLAHALKTAFPRQDRLTL